MRITNHSNLPEPFVRAAELDSYDGAGWTITKLISPPRIVELSRIHADVLEEDVSGRIWALMGTAIHKILEGADSSGIKEERLYGNLDGTKISGKFDRLVLWEKILQDYKVTSAWTIKFGSRIEEWTQQLNGYNWLLKQNGSIALKAEIWAILKDWSKMEAAKDPEYPQSDIVSVPIPLWPLSDTEKFLRDRLAKHISAQIELPLCTDKERWARPEKWALMQHGKVRAIKLFDAKPDVALSAGQYWEHRPGISARCEGYCPVSKYCSFFQGLKLKTSPPSKENVPSGLSLCQP